MIGRRAQTKMLTMRTPPRPQTEMMHSITAQVFRFCLVVVLMCSGTSQKRRR